jgi:hypothetical protein
VHGGLLPFTGSRESGTRTSTHLRLGGPHAPPVRATKKRKDRQRPSGPDLPSSRHRRLGSFRFDSFRFDADSFVRCCPVTRAATLLGGMSSSFVRFRALTRTVARVGVILSSVTKPAPSARHPVNRTRSNSGDACTLRYVTLRIHRTTDEPKSAQRKSVSRQGSSKGVPLATPTNPGPSDPDGKPSTGHVSQSYRTVTTCVHVVSHAGPARPNLRVLQPPPSATYRNFIGTSGSLSKARLPSDLPIGASGDVDTDRSFPPFENEKVLSPPLGHDGPSRVG